MKYQFGGGLLLILLLISAVCPLVGGLLFVICAALNIINIDM